MHVYTTTIVLEDGTTVIISGENIDIVDEVSGPIIEREDKLSVFQGETEGKVIFPL